MSTDAAYRGRFAPSPTGPLHFGSLVAALASYLDARHAGGQWLLRIEDIDPPREVTGAADAIRYSLERHGLLWDGEVLCQSRRAQAYEAALETLRDSGRLFHCSCTRSVLGPGGSCGRRCSPRPGASHALRFEVSVGEAFEDLILGYQAPPTAVTDIVVRRRDGLYAYALAVVVDDAWQGITHVLRGQDLLGQTHAQRQLLAMLGQAIPHYGHLPLLYSPAGAKLSKQAGATAIDDGHPMQNLRQALRLLGQDSAASVADTPAELLAEASRSWLRAPLADNAGKGLLYVPESASQHHQAITSAGLPPA